MKKRERDVLDFIQDYCIKHRYSPTYDEIGDNFGIVKSQVHHTIDRLEEMGAVVRTRNRTRSLWPTALPAPHSLEMMLINALITAVEEYTLAYDATPEDDDRAWWVQSRASAVRSAYKRMVACEKVANDLE